MSRPKSMVEEVDYATESMVHTYVPISSVGNLLLLWVVAVLCLLEAIRLPYLCLVGLVT